MEERKIAGATIPDWTVDPETGCSNSSPDFLKLVKEVGRLIRNDAATLIRGDADSTARLIMAQLAHKHGMAPQKLNSESEESAVREV